MVFISIKWWLFMTFEQLERNEVISVLIFLILSVYDRCQIIFRNYIIQEFVPLLTPNVLRMSSIISTQWAISGMRQNIIIRQAGVSSLAAPGVVQITTFGLGDDSTFVKTAFQFQCIVLYSCYTHKCRLVIAWRITWATFPSKIK